MKKYKLEVIEEDRYLVHGNNGIKYFVPATITETLGIFDSIEEMKEFIRFNFNKPFNINRLSFQVTVVERK